MNETLEIAIDSVDGTIDCQLEPKRNDAGIFYAATILYPNIVNGFSRSEVYCHNMIRDAKTGNYTFDDNEDIHPKIKRLEAQISEAILAL